MKPIVQISLDLIDLDEALKTAEIAMRAGVDWLEAGTPLLLAEGVHAVRALRLPVPAPPAGGHSASQPALRRAMGRPAVAASPLRRLLATDGRPLARRRLARSTAAAGAVGSLGLDLCPG